MTQIIFFLICNCLNLTCFIQNVTENLNQITQFIKHKNDTDIGYCRF